MTTHTQEWQHLSAPEIGDHSTPESIQLAKEITAAIESVLQDRAKAEAAWIELQGAGLDELADPVAIEDCGHEFRAARGRAMKAEIPVRSKLAEWYDRDEQDAQQASDKWNEELEATLERLRGTLRDAGFGAFFELDEQYQHFRAEHQSKVNHLLFSHPDARELARKIKHVRESKADRFSDKLENNRRLNAILEQLRAAQMKAASQF